VSVVAGIAGCARGKKGKAEDKKLEEPRPPEMSIEGTPWEAVVSQQTELLDFFETGTTPWATVAKAMKWREKRLPGFKENCGKAIEYYAKDPTRRMNVMAKAGQAWSVVRLRVDEITKDWGAAQKRDVGILLTDFECR